MGVIYDLSKSQYKTKYMGTVFYFSSEVYKRKFDEKLSGYVAIQAYKLASKLKLPVEMCRFNKLFSLSLYTQVEKRGSRIEDENGQPINL